MALCSKEPSADSVASFLQVLSNCGLIFEPLFFFFFFFSTGTRANQNRKLEPLLGSLGNFLSSLFRKPQIFLGHRLHLNASRRFSLMTRKGSCSIINAPGLHLGFTQPGSWFLLTSCKPFIVMLMTLVEDAWRRNGGRKFSRGRRKDTG